MEAGPFIRPSARREHEDTTIDAILAQLPGQLLDGFIRGLVYVAIALGLTIVFGMLRLVNFAHGAFYAIGAYVGLIVAEKLGLLAGLIVRRLPSHSSQSSSIA